MVENKKSNIGTESEKEEVKKVKTTPISDGDSSIEKISTVTPPDSVASEDSDSTISENQKGKDDNASHNEGSPLFKEDTQEEGPKVIDVQIEQASPSIEPSKIESEEEEKPKPKPKSTKRTDVFVKPYSEDLDFASSVLGDIVEPMTKLLTPVLLILMFIPVFSILAQALFLLNGFTFFMISDKWKDEFKDAAKSASSAEEAFYNHQEAVKKQTASKVSSAKMELDKQIVEQQKEIDSLLNRRVAKENTIAEISEQKTQLLNTLASATASSVIGSLASKHEDEMDQSL